MIIMEIKKRKIKEKECETMSDGITNIVTERR